MKFLLSGAAFAAGFASAMSAVAAPATPVPKVVMTPLPAAQPVSFEVFLPLRNASALNTLLEEQQTPGSASYHKWLTPAQFASQFGPTSTDVAQAKAALTGQGFQIAATHSRSLQVLGTTGAVKTTFGATLERATFSTGSSRIVAATAPVMPAALQAKGATIVKFSGRAPLHVNSRFVAAANPDNRYSASGGYWFTDLKQAYDYPSYTATVGGKKLDGTGVSVAILMEYDALDSDIKAVFDHEKFTTLTGKPAPTISRVEIDGGAPFNVDASFESSLDVQEVLGGAPGSAVSLVTLPDLSDESIIDGYLYIVESNGYDIVNSSFGGCELGYSAAYNGGVDYSGILDVYDTLFKQGNAQGITFVASSGDEGGLECPDTNYIYGTGPSRFIPSVSFPADSPHVTAVGGGNVLTSVSTPPALTSTYVSENGLGDPEIPYDPYGLGANVVGGFWGAGGGISAHFAKPSYQALVDSGSTAYRTVPDVGMQVGGCPGGIALIPCGPNRSYVIIADGGTFYGVIGTSVSSPELVGATALYLQKIGGRAGNLNNYLYAAAAKQDAGGAVSFNRPTLGFDGKYTMTTPGRGYNYIYGNGSPNVRALFGMTALPAAGDPQTLSNP